MMIERRDIVKKIEEEMIIEVAERKKRREKSLLVLQDPHLLRLLLDLEAHLNVFFGLLLCNIL